MCRQFTVRGRVQGVFFRASTRDAASRLGLRGHAINLADGSVDVIVCGSDEGMRKMSDWLQKGPPMAVVAEVEEKVTDCAMPQGFSIG
jgi:acylphosphatase